MHSEFFAALLGLLLLGGFVFWMKRQVKKGTPKGGGTGSRSGSGQKEK